MINVKTCYVHTTYMFKIFKLYSSSGKNYETQSGESSLHEASKLVSAISTAGSGNFSGPRFGTELPAQFVDRASQLEVLDSCCCLLACKLLVIVLVSSKCFSISGRIYVIVCHVAGGNTFFFCCICRLSGSLGRTCIRHG